VEAAEEGSLPQDLSSMPGDKTYPSTMHVIHDALPAGDNTYVVSIISSID
jgi:hypothetical protein